MTAKAAAAILVLLSAIACAEFNEEPMNETGETGSFDVAVGDRLGPCPVDEWGSVDLCNSESLACVPANDSTANVCLSVVECDDAGFGLAEVGWGGACYVRCGSDSDCMDGMVCGNAVSDGKPMCAWPR